MAQYISIITSIILETELSYQDINVTYNFLILMLLACYLHFSYYLAIKNQLPYCFF